MNQAQPVFRARQRFTSNVIPPLYIAADMLCLAISAPIALFAHGLVIGGRTDPHVHLVAAVVAAVAFFMIRSARDAYAQSFFHDTSSDGAVVVDYVVGSLFSIAIVWQFGLADQFSRGLTLFYVASVITMLFVSRLVLRVGMERLARSGRIGQRVVLYGADPVTAERAYRCLEQQSLPHLQLVGVADDRGTAPNVPLPFIGGFNELVTLARAGGVDQVFIALPDINQARLEQILEELSAVSVDVSMIPREVLALTPSYQVSFLGTLPVLTFWQRPYRDINVLVKRAEDVAIAGLATILLSPLLLVTAALVKLTSPGPILFVQPRFGFNNNEIGVFKFRSMYVAQQDVLGSARTRKGDKRITPVGRIIRRLSIDELPQLWNVLRGDMSIVGPRPHATHMKVGDRYYFDAVQGYAARHRVKPGITGLAQVRGLRGEIDTIEKAKKRVAYDKEYIDNWSLALDLRIILETAIKLVIDKNAY